MNATPGGRPVAANDQPAAGRPIVGRSAAARSSAALPTVDTADPPEPLWGGIGGEAIDRQVHASIARLTMGLSPASLAEAFGDWAIHLAISPGKQAQLVQKAVRKAVR